MMVDIDRVLKDIQNDFKMGGLSDGLYADYAVHVAYTLFHKVVNQCVQENADTDEDTRDIANRMSDILSEAWNVYWSERGVEYFYEQVQIKGDVIDSPLHPIETTKRGDGTVIETLKNGA